MNKKNINNDKIIENKFKGLLFLSSFFSKSI